MVYRLINSTYNLRELVPRLAKLISHVLNSDYCTVILLDPNKKTVRLRANISQNKKVVSERKVKLREGLENRIIHSGTALLKRYVLGVPLVGEEVSGAIIIKRNNSKKYYDIFDQEILIAISEQAVTAIRNLQLYEEQQKLILGSIKSLVTLLDKKVPSVYSHSPMFSRIALDIAEQLHLNESQIRSLRYASLLHDAGKIDIPVEIITKRSKLTSEEYSIIKSHPLRGVEIIRPLEILKPVIPIILYHHEKYDGTGYPSGLKRNQIPIGARIMSVADAFEAMVLGRPYKGTKSIRQAIEEIKENSGTQFDPIVVEAFLKIAKKRKFKKYLSLYR
jgi:putative nucleotidyltransferase with HDIG domain